MEKETISSTPAKAGSNRRIWLIVLIVVLCLGLLCCALIVAGILFLQPVQVKTYITGILLVPTSTNRAEVIPTPTGPAIQDISSILDAKAEPIWGLIDLQRGFSPDPRIEGLVADGEIDTSPALDCGFTTPAPTIAFHLYGGASETFLRLYFIPAEALVNTSLIVHTPDQRWLCVTNSPGGTAPMVDFEMAPSGNYSVWVGVPQAGDSLFGDLYLTGSTTNTP
jgi:hypothetical protein